RRQRGPGDRKRAHRARAVLVDQARARAAGRLPGVPTRWPGRHPGRGRSGRADRLGRDRPGRDDRAVSGALDGVLVVDLSRALAGPHAAMMLGDLGARVIKVESPDGGDDTRSWGPPFMQAGDGERHSTYF